jgi:hypothetical protein
MPFPIPALSVCPFVVASQGLCTRRSKATSMRISQWSNCWLNLTAQWSREIPICSYLFSKILDHHQWLFIKSLIFIDFLHGFPIFFHQFFRFPSLQLRRRQVLELCEGGELSLGGSGFGGGFHGCGSPMVVPLAGKFLPSPNDVGLWHWILVTIYWVAHKWWLL